MADTLEGPPSISPKALSDALAALGAYSEPPTDTQLAGAELRDGRPALVARLSNALYGSALGLFLAAEVVAEEHGVPIGYRHEAWQAAGADSEGMAILLHYSAMRLAAELGRWSSNWPST